MIERLQFFLITLMLLGAPLIAGGKSTYSLLFLELTGLTLLGLVLWSGYPKQNLPKLVWWTLVFGLAIPLVYLLPIPLSIWEMLPSRSQFIDAVGFYKQHSNHQPWLSLSLVPEKTLHAWLALIPLLAMFLAISRQADLNLLRIIYLIIGLASVEALLGIAQYNTQLETLFPFNSHSNTAASQDAIGSYINRDHFVALLYMALPLALSQIFYRFGTSDLRRSVRQHGIRSNFIIMLIMLILASLVLIIGATLSRSRAGIFLTIIALVLCTIIFARHLGGKRSASLSATIIIISLGIISSLGLIPILNRFIALDPFEDGRWSYFQITLEGIKQFFPVGTGPSTFQEIYRTIQPYEQLGFLNHAHNDYLELIFECGLLGILFILLFFGAYISAWFRLRGASWDQTRFLKVACGISCGLLLIHTLVDFNLHTPANALVFTALLGIFLKKIEP